MKLNLIIPAGGTSSRFGSKNKLFESCGSSCVIVESIKPFLEINEISKIIIAINSAYSDKLLTALDNAKINENKIVLARGGDTRTESVKNGLKCIDDDADFILVHDSARPYITTSLIQKVIDNAKIAGCSLPVINMTNALVKVDEGVQCVNRDNYKGVQTPICVKKDIIVSAYNKSEGSFFDDLSLIQKYENVEVSLVEGDINNIKITFDSDLKKDFLTGIGYDIHRMKKGNGIKLLGVEIPCDYSFIAHSDGDVPIHALMDAILSAIGEKDIGHLFPVDDTKYDDANSIDLLNIVLIKVKDMNYKVANMSVSIIAETPKLAPYIDLMKETMSSIVGIDTTKIGITATTNEKVGNLGNSESIASFATVLLEKI